jgi:hypothetical protein
MHGLRCSDYMHEAFKICQDRVSEEQTIIQKSPKDVVITEVEFLQMGWMRC